MKTFWKVLLVIFLILLVIFLIVVGVAGVTFYQAMGLKERADAFAIEVNALREDCSNAGGVEVSLYELRDEIKSACRNPILKWIAEKNFQEDVCAQVRDDEYINSVLIEIKNNCGQSEL